MALMDLIVAYPRLSIILMAFAVSFLITLINNFVMDKERMREIKARQKEIQKEMTKHRKEGNHDKVLELNKEMMSYVGETFKQSFKPMLITIVPIIVFFSFIRNAYAETIIAGSWFWWYLLGAIGSSMIFRKVFRMP